MDPKTIGFGIAVAIASVGGSALVVSIKDVPVKPDATLADVAVHEVTQVNPVLASKSCVKMWAWHPAESKNKLGWICDGAWMPPSVQTELGKMAGAQGTQIVFTPRQDGEAVVFDAQVTTGQLPAEPSAVLGPK